MPSFREFYQKRPDLVFWTITVLAVLLVFWPYQFTEFLFADDYDSIVLNPVFHPFNFDGLTYIWTHSFFGLYFPVAQTIWGFLIACLQSLVGPDWASQQYVRPFLVLHMLVHAGSGFLVGKLLRKLSSDSSIEAEFWIKFAVLLFLFHPMQIESLGWVTGGRDVFWIFFALLSLLAFVNKRQGLCIFYFVLAILCKPVAAVLPVLFIFSNTQLPGGERLPTKALFRFVAPLLAGGGLFLFYASKIQAAYFMPTTSVPYGVRVAGFIDTLGFYLEKLLLPFNVTADFGRSTMWLQKQTFTFEMILFVMAAFGLAWAIKKYPRQRTKILCIAAFVIVPLLPVSGIGSFIFQSHSNVAARYAGFSIIGLAWAFYELGKWRFADRKWIVCPVIGIFMSISFDNIQYWRSNQVLALHVLEVNPESFMANHILGSVEQVRNDNRQALALFTRATELNPASFVSWISRARILVKSGELDMAVAAYDKLARDFPTMGNINYEYGLLLKSLAHYDKAIAQLKEALNKGYSPALTYHQIGMLHAKTNDFEQSVLYFEKALELDPENESFQKSYNHALDLAKAFKNLGH